MKFSEHPDYVKYRTIPNYLYAKIAWSSVASVAVDVVEIWNLNNVKYALSTIMQRAFGGKHEEGNIALWCVKPCGLAKDRRDARDRAKVRSLTSATAKSKKPKKKIQSRGFNDSYKPNIKEID